MKPTETPYDDRIAELEPDIEKRESAMKLWRLLMNMRLGYETGYQAGYEVGYIAGWTDTPVEDERE